MGEQTGQIVDQAWETRRKKDELRKATAEFEAIFLTHLVRAMRKSIPRSRFLHGGFAEDVFQDLMDIEIASQGARREKGFGIGEMLYKKFEKYVLLSTDSGRMQTW